MTSEKPAQLVRFDPAARQVALAPPMRTVPMMAPDADPSMRHLMQVVGRHKILLASFFVFAMAAGTALCLLVDPVYDAVAQVEIDRRSATEGINQAESQTTMIGDMDQIVTTQVELVQSDPVLRPVAEKYHLLSIEHQLDGAFGKKLTPAEIKHIVDGPVELKKLKVKRPPNSYLIDITYRATSPKLAAEVANAIAQSYIAYIGRLRSEDSAGLRATMVRQKADLERTIDQETQRISDLTRQLNVIDPQQRTTVLSNRLNQLTAEYTAAQADRSRKGAESQVVNTGSIPSAQVSAQADALNRALEHRNDLLQQLANVKTTYGENYPDYVKVASQVTETNRQIEELRSNIALRSASAYQEAAKHEEGIKAVLDRTRAEFDQLTARSVEYQRIVQQSDDDKKQYNDLVERLRNEELSSGFQKGTAHLASAARPPSEIAFPKIPIVLAVAAVIALIMGLCAVVLADTIESRVSGAENAARRMSINVMAKLPVIRRQISIAKLAQSGLGSTDKGLKSFEWFHESIRTLMNTLVLTVDPEQTRTILFTSCTPGEGKSTVSSHLALAAASMRRKTLLIDADMRRGTAHRMFQIPLGDGLSRVMEGKLHWTEAVCSIEGQPNLFVIPAGRWSQEASTQFGFLMPGIAAEASSAYDLVLIDAPPLAFAESIQLSMIADGVIVVAHADKTSAASASSLLGKLQALNVNIVGMVLNHAKDGMFGGYYKSYYGYRPASQEVVPKEMARGAGA
jgi:capsular exopolysaccharide synthesis family protein